MSLQFLFYADQIFKKFFLKLKINFSLFRKKSKSFFCFLQLTIIFLLLKFSDNTETRANTYTNNVQSNPSITSASDGGFYIFWQSLLQINNWDVFGQRFDRSHNKIGTETLINSSTNGDQSGVNATTMPTGKVLVVYHSNQTGDFDVRMKIFDSNLILLIPEFVVNTITDADQLFAKVCGISNNKFAVVYLEKRNNDWDVFAAIYDDNKTLIKGSFVVNTNRNNSQGDRGLSCKGLPDGKFIIAYNSYNNSPDNNYQGVFSVIYNADYTVYKSEFLINQGTSNDQCSMSLDVNRNQKLVATWESNQDNSSIWNSYFRLLDLNGNFLIGEKLANNYINSNGLPVVLKASWNNFIICWRGPCQGCAKYEISCRLIDDKGNYLTNDMRITYEYPNDHESISITQLNSLQNVIAWQVLNQDGSNWGVYFDTFNGHQLVNFITENTQEDPFLNKLNNGGFLITWTCTNACESTNTNSNGCRGQFYDKYGNKVNSEFQINKTETNNQEKCRSLTLSNNNIFLIWQSQGQDKVDFGLLNMGIYGKIISENGTLVKDEFLINTSTYNTQYLPNLISPKDNLIVVSWSSKHARCAPLNCDFTVWSKFFDNSGTLIKDEFMINSRTSGNQDHSSLCTLKDSRILYVWDSDSNQDGSGLGIYGRITDYSGNFVSLEFKINKTTAGDQINPSCAGLLNNRFVVTYESGTDIMGIIFNSDLTVFKDEFTVNTYKTNTQTNAKVFSLNDGKFIVGWESNLQDGSIYGVYYQLFDTTGISVGNETLASAVTFQDQKQITFTQLTSGAVAMAYTSYGDSYDTGIYYDFIVICPDGRFLDNNAPDRCSFCDFKCATCNNKNDCLTCASGYNALEEVSNICLAISTCPNGYMPKPSNRICKKCDISCINCTSTISTCLSCNISEGYYNSDDFLNTCYKTAPIGYIFDNTLNKYVKCDLSCKSCSTSKTNCSECNTSSLYYPKVDAINTCILKTASPNGYFFNSATNQHEKCDISCINCTTTLNNCSTCNNSGGYYNSDVNLNACSNILPDGYFLDSIAKKYKICDTSCLSCSTSANNCIQCNNSSLYYPKVDATNTCILKTASPNGYFFNSATNQHEKCDISCINCTTTLNNCSTCNNSGGYYNSDVNLNACSNILPDGYFLDSFLKKYVICDVSCKTCATSKSSCNLCNSDSNYYPKTDDIKTCILKSSSPNGYYFDIVTNKHEKCDISCLTCVDSLKKCLTCNNTGGYYNADIKPNDCLNASPDGYFLDSSLKKYIICDVSCKTCINSSTYCTLCNNNSFYFSKSDETNKCILKTNSPDGYYFDSSTNKHEKCNISCLTCVISASYCLLCNIPGNYYSTNETPQTCLTTPPNGYYLDQKQNKYLKCDVSCDGCTLNSLNCKKCNQSNVDDSLKYFNIVTDTGSCFLTSNTPIFYYFSLADKIFKQCDVSCRTCIKAPSYCLTCNTNYYAIQLEPSKCVLNCPEKTWKNFIDKYCSPCHESCKNCIDSTVNCLECNDGYFPLEDNKKLCFKNCPLGYIFDPINKICKKCPSNCESCNLDGICLLCFSGNFLNTKNKQCYSRCDPGFYGNNSDRVCVQCVSPCIECFSNSYCSACIQDQFINPLLTANNCASTCPDGYFANSSTGKCEICDKKCKICKSSPKNCQSCINDFYYNNDTDECLIKCPINKYFPKENSLYSATPNDIPIKVSFKTCEKCNIGCLTCIKSNDYCLTCEDGFFLIQSLNNCVKVCPDGFYPDLSQGFCQNCNFSCSTCKGPLSNDCLTCDISSGKILKNGSCIKEGCPNGTIMLPNLSCFGLAQCIDFANLSLPKLFNMELNPLIVKFTMSLKPICDDFKKGFGLSWDPKSNLYDKAKFSADNSTYTIDREIMEEGPLNLKLDVLYDNKFLLASFNQTTILLLNKVKIRSLIIFILNSFIKFRLFLLNNSKIR